MVFDLSPTWSNLRVCPCLSTPSTQVRALKLLASRSAWIKALHYRKRKQHMLSLFYMGLNGFPLMHACVNVRFPSPLARQRRHAWPRITPGDRMGTRTYAHIAGLGRHDAGADGCQGGYGGHNGRMWSIVLAHGAMERGLPEANVMASHMWRARWLMAVRAEPVQMEKTRNVTLNFSLRLILWDVISDIRWCEGERVMKMICIQQVLPKCLTKGLSHQFCCRTATVWTLCKM